MRYYQIRTPDVVSTMQKKNVLSIHDPLYEIFHLSITYFLTLGHKSLGAILRALIVIAE